MKQQFVVPHTIRHNEIPAFLDSWVYNHTFCQHAVSTKKHNFFHLRKKKVTCLTFRRLTSTIVDVPYR